MKCAPISKSILPNGFPPEAARALILSEDIFTDYLLLAAPSVFFFLEFIYFIFVFHRNSPTRFTPAFTDNSPNRRIVPARAEEIEAGGLVQVFAGLMAADIARLREGVVEIVAPAVLLHFSNKKGPRGNPGGLS
ncbi:MAG: hypothetical protein JXR73_19015 [Candidatus Omnitrophica bacterium]|nr:hypothetical protein [Candidatus Omnitrophota bacterium]